MVEKTDIVTEYRRLLKEKGVFTWSDFLEKETDGWGPIFYRLGDSEFGACRVCNERMRVRYIGSHFRQTGNKTEEHQKYVERYDQRLKGLFNKTLNEHGYKLKEPITDEFCKHVWESARKDAGSVVHCWDRVVEKL